MNPVALVTGGAGFIGSHLVLQLVAAGWQVRVIDRKGLRQQENARCFPPQVALQWADIFECDWSAQLKNVQVVFHLAALAGVREVVPEQEHFRINVAGTQHILAAMRSAGVRQMVFTSSSSVYGEGAGQPSRESDPLHPKSSYAKSKLEAEGRIFDWMNQDCGVATIFRPFTVYGIRQRPQMVIPNFIEALRMKRPMVIFGNRSRDFTAVEDVVSGLLAGIGRAGIFNLGTGISISIGQLGRNIAEILGVAAEFKHQAAHPADVASTCADLTWVRRELNWAPLYSLEGGLQRILCESLTRVDEH